GVLAQCHQLKYVRIAGVLVRPDDDGGLDPPLPVTLCLGSPLGVSKVLPQEELLSADRVQRLLLADDIDLALAVHVQYQNLDFRLVHRPRRLGDRQLDLLLEMRADEVPADSEEPE